MDNNEVINKLNSINWSFDFTINYGRDILHPFNCRKYYSYPATFIPEIPYALIEILSNKGDVVLDPFGGIGTTFMQALTLERVPYSYDINPIVSDVCNTLYMLFNPNIDKELIKQDLLQLYGGYNETMNYSTNLSSHLSELAGWFEENTFNELAFLFQQYDNIKNQTIKKVMRLILSSILVKLSSQNKGWAYIADNVKPKLDELKRKPVFDYYNSSVNNLLTDIVEHKSKLSGSFNSFYEKISQNPRVFEDSIINTSIRSETVNLVVTSPPYPKMIDYVKSQRLSFDLYNKNLKDYVDKEIGARCRRARQDSLDNYKSSMKEVNAKIVDLIQKDGYLCVVLPEYEDSDNRREVIDNIVSTYIELGLKKVYDVSRYIPSHKRTLSIQWATLVNERIYIFQKG